MKIKKVLSLLMCILILFGTVMAFNACSKKSPEEETEEAEVETTESYETKARQAVFKKAENWYWSHTIGGKDLNSSWAQITNMKREWDSNYNTTAYVASGIFTATDIYGTKYTNTFDCTVKRVKLQSGSFSRDDKWEAGDFKFKSTYWN